MKTSRLNFLKTLFVAPIVGFVAPLIPKSAGTVNPVFARSSPVVATPLKLKSEWTIELAQDLNAYYSIDAEKELCGLLTQEIQDDFDKEILTALEYPNKTIV